MNIPASEQVVFGKAWSDQVTSSMAKLSEDPQGVRSSLSALFDTWPDSKTILPAEPSKVEVGADKIQDSLFQF